MKNTTTTAEAATAVAKLPTFTTKMIDGSIFTNHSEEYSLSISLFLKI